MENRRIGSPVVELSGNRRAVVDGCDGIVEYGEEQVIFRAGGMKLRFTGRNLRLVKLTDSAAVVEGLIQQVEYLWGASGQREKGREGARW